MGYNLIFVPSTPLNAGFVSNAQQVQTAHNYAIQMSFSGSICLFSTQILVSSDAYNNAKNYVPSHFDPLANSLVTFTSAGTFTYDVWVGAYVWVALQVIDNSGGTNTSSIIATINVKD